MELFMQNLNLKGLGFIGENLLEKSAHNVRFKLGETPFLN